MRLEERNAAARDTLGSRPSLRTRRLSLPGSRSHWLALATPGGPIDLPALLPSAPLAVETDAAAFVVSLESEHPALAILVSPPAGPAELQRVSAWLTRHPEARAVLLSDHHGVAARLQALELGFEDAIDASSDPIEIAGRLAIAGRMAEADSEEHRRVRVGDGVLLDPRARAVWRGGRPLALRPKEFELLEFLAGHPGQAFTREELLRQVWGGSAGSERVVDVYVYFLRAKLERDPANPIHLVTLRGAGYRLDLPSDDAAEPGGAGQRPLNVNERPTRR